MYALMEVVSLAHEHSCDEGDMDLIDSVQALLTSDNMECFTNMCEDGGHGCSGESDLYVMYNQHLVHGRTRYVQVSVGVTTDEQDREDDATGWGNYECDMARTYFRFVSSDIGVCRLSRTTFGAGARVLRRVLGKLLANTDHS
jgi:hypothetical protein